MGRGGDGDRWGLEGRAAGGTASLLRHRYKRSEKYEDEEHKGIMYRLGCF